MGNIAIHTQNLGKTYDGTVYALHDLSLEIPVGTVFGFLGPNGAGKTTTVKLLMGLIKPTAGSCTMLGISPYKKPEKVHRLCGVVTETAQMYARLTGMENLMFFGQVLGLERRECRQRTEGLLKRFDLWDVRDKRLAAYSTGMVRRLSMARAMLSRPSILILDEPTNGLDSESTQQVYTMLVDLVRREGVTVFLCTHQIRSAQNLCDHYGIISNGKMLACGDLESLSKEIGVPLCARFCVREGQTPEGLHFREGNVWEKEIADEEEMPKLLKHMILSGIDVFAAQVVHPSLEDIYSRILALGEG
ncbi:MAG: Daunorubicin/doxorubicin resistance ATP-binding protein DrrA [Oscillospiraceae bacterium]|jgi:ABC-2 type transport system ATP-binding protein